MMNYRAIAHVAVREARTAQGWATLPPGAGWAEATASGVQLDLVFLRRDALQLALERTAEPLSEPGRLSHFALEVSQKELEALRTRAGVMGCLLNYNNLTTILFAAPYGVRWEIMLNSFSRSTGESTGRWLEVRQA